MRILVLRITDWSLMASYIGMIDPYWIDIEEGYFAFFALQLCNSHKLCNFASVLRLFREMKRSIIFIVIIGGLLTGCREHTVPKPYGYFRIAIPDTAFTSYSPQGYPYKFLLSENAVVRPHAHQGESYWIDIQYPTLNATIHCSYKPVHDNLRLLSQDAQEFLYKHAVIATSIPEQGFENPDAHVWGVYCELNGNTATPIQFYVTDSVKHFFRGSVYCNAVPNQDSLAPIYDYMRQDVRRLMESFSWQY